jgi:NADH dehydrogenase
LTKPRVGARPTTSDFHKRVVIVGANFAGLTAAMRLSPEYRVTVVDPAPYFEFLPSIHELVSGLKRPEHLRLSRERLLRPTGHRFVQESVTAIHSADRRVETRSGASLEFDACVVAVGGVHNTFGVPGAAEFGMPFKSVDDCWRIGERLRSLLAGDAEVSVVIVGGGLEGIEALGEILRRYRHRRGLSVHVVEVSGRLLPDQPDALDRAIRTACVSMPVRFHLAVRVAFVRDREVELSSGETIASDVTIWTGGAAPPPLLVDAGLAGGEGRWAAVKPTLQSVFYDSIFVAGDAAALPAPLAKQAYHAIDMGACAAENARAFLDGRQLRVFQPTSEVTLMAFGDLDTHLILGGHVVSGTVLAAAKEAVYQFSMARIDPPVNTTSFFQLQDRSWTGALNLFLPVVASPYSLLRLANLRVLS